MTALHRPVRRSAWTWFPWYVAAAMGVVVAVNAGMAWTAISSFPGLAEQDVFDHSNAYDQVLATAQREAALGWSLLLVREGTIDVAVLTRADGRPLTGAEVHATARRPLGPDHAIPLVLHETTPGRYVADAALPLPGQWDLLLSARLGGAAMHATRRVVVK